MKKLHLPAIGALLLWAATLCAFTSCDDDTATIGTSIMPDFDNVSTSQAIYTVHSKAVKVDSVLANTSDCYLGRIVDPETRAQTTCNFLAQFHVLEDYAFPTREEIVCDDNGDPIADSCVLRIFFDRYYGDSLTTMTLHVQELDTAKVMEENVSYYTNLDAADYLSTTSPIRTDVSYAVKDLSRPDSVTDGSTYLRSVVIKLPASYGQHLLKKYYENPANYQDSYQFIHHVCPGFYFQTTGGTGVMLNAEVTTLDVHFRYKSKTALLRDTIWERTRRENPEFPYVLDMLTLRKQGVMTCMQGCAYLGAVARALGLPVACDGVFQWANYSNMGHNWIALTCGGHTYTALDGDSVAREFNQLDASTFPKLYKLEADYPLDASLEKRAAKVWRFAYRQKENPVTNKKLACALRFVLLIVLR